MYICDYQMVGSFKVLRWVFKGEGFIFLKKISKNKSTFILINGFQRRMFEILTRRKAALTTSLERNTSDKRT